MTSPARPSPQLVPSDSELMEYRAALAKLTRRCLMGIAAANVPIDAVPLCSRERPESPVERR